MTMKCMCRRSLEGYRPFLEARFLRVEGAVHVAASVDGSEKVESCTGQALRVVDAMHAIKKRSADTILDST